jgi:hypothetical protein
MQIVEAITIQAELDPWLTLRALNSYSGLSVRSLRRYLTDPRHPLPHYRMKDSRIIATKAGQPRTVRGKVLVRRSEFDRWMEGFRHTPDVDKIVNEVMEEFRPR